MKRIMLVAFAALYGVLVFIGCTSHSWTQIERNHVATYGEVFETIPALAPKCKMKLKESNYDAGTMTLSCHRTADEILTGSLINMFAGDEVLIKIKSVNPLVTSVWINSKAKGQIGTDFGRTDRNVMALTKVLDQQWAVKEDEDQLGEKR